MKKDGYNQKQSEIQIMLAINGHPYGKTKNYARVCKHGEKTTYAKESETSIRMAVNGHPY